MAKGQPKPVYTDAQKQALVDRAAQIGLTPAVKELGYPETVATASRWCTALGVTVQKSALATYAASMKSFYGHREKMALLHRLLDEAYDILVNGEKDPEQETVTQDPMTGEIHVDYIRKPVSAVTISRLVSSVQRTIQTIELLEGRATERAEVINPDSTDVELASMIREYKAKNAVQEQELRGVQ